jgi:dinuclear metal center YbgI/SA1388 family protein
MPKLSKITEFLDNYLVIDDIDDTCWNGLQFEGVTEVKKVAFAVDAGVESFECAANENADMLIVHHGHFWSNHDPSIRGWTKERIDCLYKNGISLYACHLPLDRHREVGNNSELIKLLGAQIKDEFLIQKGKNHKGKNIGWTGKFKKPVSIEDIVKKLDSKLNTECTVLPFGKEKINTVAVCSGGGGYGGFYEALRAGADLFLTGDSVEIYYTAKDSGMNVIFAGHHATETLGLVALSKVIEKRFKLDTVFIDLPTGL